MSRGAVLALDLGTTGVRALAVDGDGSIRARAWRPIVSRFPRAGWLEQDPNEWWQRSQEVLREALAASRLDRRDFAGIGVVTQRATAVAWDAATGAPLAPAIGWQDQRTEPRVRELVGQGIPVNTMASATKFEWLLAHEPALRAAATAGRLRLGSPDAWLGDRLSGGRTFVTDASQASCTGLYDLRAGTWHDGALALFGIERGWLPALAPTSGVAGTTGSTLLGVDVAVAARAGDQQAASFAQGVLAPGQAKMTLGTSAMLDLHTGATPSSALAGSYPLALYELSPGRRAFCLEGTVITAGAAIEWLVDLGLLGSSSGLDPLLAATPTANGVTFVPSLQGLGTPFGDAQARGALLGLTRGVRAEHVVRAVLEGIAQRCADVVEAMPLAPGPLRVDGGLARCDAFVALLADLCGRGIRRAVEIETTALGAALLAGIATGTWKDAEAALATVPAPGEIEPQMAETERAQRRAGWRRAIARAR